MHALSQRRASTLKLLQSLSQPPVFAVLRWDLQRVSMNEICKLIQTGTKRIQTESAYNAPRQ
jgi:hypothetical protein